MQTPRNTEAPITEYMLIDGKLVDGTERIEVRNPARPDELVGTIVRGSPAHVDDAVAAAKARQPAWAGLTFTERAGILRKALSRLEADIDRRAAIFVRENGKQRSRRNRPDSRPIDAATRPSLRGRHDLMAPESSLQTAYQ